MSTIEITRVEDVREGDIVTIAYEGHEFTGVAWAEHGQSLLHIGGSWIEHFDFVRAFRELPDLPTEPGSVIVNATIRGVRGYTAILVDLYGTLTWITPAMVHGVNGHPIDSITAWTLAKVVPVDGQQS